MKRHVLYSAMAVVVCALLCGCGNDRIDNEAPIIETPAVSPVIEPSVTPLVTPDMEDGIVDDRDGIIEDKEEERGSMSGEDSSRNASTGRSENNTTTKR